MASALVIGKRQCHIYSTCRPVPQASKWQVRTCDKQPIVGQIARHSRSSSAEDRVVQPKATTVRAVGEGAALRHRQKPLPHVQRMATNIICPQMAGADVR